MRHNVLSSVIGQRRSIRRYYPARIGTRIIERLLRAAAQAPSAHNRQPWRFVVLQDRDSREMLAAAMGERLRQDRSNDHDDPQAIEADISRSYARLSAAPAVILVCLDMRDMDTYPDERRRKAEYLMATQSLAMATQNLLLAAEQERLGACIMCAPLFCPDTVVAKLALPQTWEPQMLVTLGRPANPGRARSRMPLSQITLWWKAPTQQAR
ncbi:MAG: nitroreductase family protein [Bryobacteraceae bacterium]